MADPKPMTKERIAELQALCDAATPGPWFAGGERNPNWLYAKGGQYSSSGWQLGDMSGARCEEDQDVANTAFIAAARTALPDAIDEIERLRALLEARTAFVDSIVQSEHETLRLRSALEEIADHTKNPCNRHACCGDEYGDIAKAALEGGK